MALSLACDSLFLLLLLLLPPLIAGDVSNSTTLQPCWNSFHSVNQNMSLIIRSFSYPTFYSLGFRTLPRIRSAVFLCIWFSYFSDDAYSFTEKQIVWRANVHKPIYDVAILHVTDDHTLILTDKVGTPIWNVSDVVRIQMTDSGNLKLLNAVGRTVWQSFGNPTDTLVQTQTLETGMKLVSNSSLYSVVVELAGVFFFVNLPQPLPFWYFTVGSFNSTMYPRDPSCSNAKVSGLGLQGIVLRFVVSNCSLNISCPEEVMLLRLEDDGHLRAYAADTTPYDLWSSQVKIGTMPNVLGNSFGPIGPANCYDPNVCGTYSICNSTIPDYDKRCSCPFTDPTLKFGSLFNPLDRSDPSKGCTPVTAPSCNTSDDHFLYEMKGVTFVSVIIHNWNHDTRSLNDCRSLCELNCSCAAIFYQHSTSICVSVDTVMSMMSADKTDYSAFVKVPSPLSERTPYLKPKPSPGPTPDLKARPSDVRKTLTRVITPIVTVIALVLAGLVLAAVWRFLKKSTPLSDTDMSDEELLKALPSLPRRFGLRELNVATDGFRRKLGEGAFSSVYEGLLSDGRRVAVKKIDLIKHGQKQFLNEVATISGSSHFNIVRLFGYCSARPNRMLVYEYMDNGSLDRWLFADSGHPFLDWGKRFHVALGTAQGIAYLHEECTAPVLHLDIKPQNILLDAQFVPKLADFGLSRLIDRDCSRVMTQVRGTPGYIAPEWLLSHSTVSKKCDVYSFGMVLLEVVCGRKIVEVSKLGSEEWHLPSWVAGKWVEGTGTEVVDGGLGGSYEEEEAGRMIKVGLWCIQEDPNLRPRMSEVVKMLQGKMEVQWLPSPAPFLQPQAHYSKFGIPN